eukprot:TRINITY_DN31575_c0_g1_i1.p1 TRINITY_DN31575_c0_g1~~TRINITY_DN31575_c0_g1_i1.p1  ORF type:complete len:463 (+),score=96.25 TRINITY_DN31575_c0_g1_i1:47-1435(+)
MTNSKHHGFCFKGALMINPGGEQSLPIPVAEPSVLEIEWSTEDELDVEFSVEFTPDGVSNTETLVLPERSNKKEGVNVDIGSAGKCAVILKNCYVGWLGGGSIRKIAYTATLRTKWELEQEAKRKAASEQEEADRERRRIAREAERQRRAEAEAEIARLRGSAEAKQREASQLLGSSARKQQEAEALRKRLEELEASAKDELKRSGVLAHESALENKEAIGKRQHEFEVSNDWPMALQVTFVRAVGLKHLNFTGDNPWCKCVVKQNNARETPSKCETNVAHNTLEPEWNETYEIDWRLGEALEFHVYDQGTIGSKEEGSAFVLPSERFYPAGLEEDLRIKGLESATLRVRIVPLVDSALPPAPEPHWPVPIERWSSEQSHVLGQDPSSFEGKAMLLMGYDSPVAAVEALNSANIDIPKAIIDDGYCVILHASKQTHTLLYRSDMLETVSKIFLFSVRSDVCS